MAFIRFVVIMFLLVSTIHACQFSSSCTDISFHNNMMYAKCSRHGYILKASIEVNKCISRDYRGNLVCSSSGGGLDGCSDIKFNGLTVSAVCPAYRGRTVYSNRALDDCIANVEGTLKCC